MKVKIIICAHSGLRLPMTLVTYRRRKCTFKVERCCYVCSDDEGTPGGSTAKKSRIDKGGANGLVTASPLGSKQTRYRSTESWL